MADNKDNINNAKGIKSGDRKKAVAILYDPGNKAPQVVAAGQGMLADKIINVAKDNEVPLYKDTNLTETLLKLDIGECIPPELYGVVAEILVYVDKMDKIKSKLDM